MAKTFAMVNGVVTEVETLSAKEAAEVKRQPMVKTALDMLTQGNADLVSWLLDNKGQILGAFGAGTVRRVTKQERKALQKALDYIVEVMKNDPKAKFVVEHAVAISETFKWPNQKRVAPEDKANAIKEAFLDITEGNAELSDWLVANEAALEEAYNAGVEKRQVSQATLDALAAARAKRGAAATA